MLFLVSRVVDCRYLAHTLNYRPRPRSKDNGRRGSSSRCARDTAATYVWFFAPLTALGFRRLVRQGLGWFGFGARFPCAVFCQCFFAHRQVVRHSGSRADTAVSANQRSVASSGPPARYAIPPVPPLLLQQTEGAIYFRRTLPEITTSASTSSLRRCLQLQLPSGARDSGGIRKQPPH